MVLIGETDVGWVKVGGIECEVGQGYLNAGLVFKSRNDLRMSSSEEEVSN
jgi:hypothetical protein